MLWEETVLTIHSGRDRPEIVQLKQRIYICLMFKCFVLHAKTEPGAVMHYDSEQWAQCLSLIKLFLNLNRGTVTAQWYAWWDWERGVSEPDTVSITGHGGNWRRCVLQNVEGGVQSRVKTICKPPLKKKKKKKKNPLAHTHTHSPVGNPIHGRVWL